VHVDQKRLRQILINLLSNAIKFTERGSATLTVRYRSQVAEFEISDTGVGIPVAEIERVFEPFERGQGANVRAIRAPDSASPSPSCSRRSWAARSMPAASRAGGTTFTVRLLLSEAAPVSDGRASSDGVRAVTGYAGERRRVLLIDDDPAHLDIVQNLLQPLGFALFTAHDGPSGIALAAECRPTWRWSTSPCPG
jgi:hypothetical protein